jgi:hypothetical protein
MAKQKPTSLFKNGATTEKQRNELFRQTLIEFIKKYDSSYEHIDFSGYSTTQLVLLKVEMEIFKNSREHI